MSITTYSAVTIQERDSSCTILPSDGGKIPCIKGTITPILNSAGDTITFIPIGTYGNQQFKQINSDTVVTLIDKNGVVTNPATVLDVHTELIEKNFFFDSSIIDINDRLTELENAEIQITVYRQITTNGGATSGQITFPTGSRLDTNAYKEFGNCVLSKIGISGGITYEDPKDDNGKLIDSTLDINGNWNITRPIGEDIAIIFSLITSRLDYAQWSNGEFAYVIDEVDFSNDGIANVIYLTSADSPFTVTEEMSGSTISCNTNAGQVNVILPDVASVKQGFKTSIVHYEGVTKVLVTTTSGIDDIGSSPIQLITQEGKSITVIAQKESGSDEYLIVQDSRNVPNNRFVITKKEDFILPIDPNAIYFVDRSVDMGSVSIEVPPEGMTVAGYGFGVSALNSSADNYTMFTHNPSTGSGDLFLARVEFIVDGVNSKVLDLDNLNAGSFDAVEMDTVNFINCTDIGTLKNYRQGLMTNVALISCGDGIEIDGTWIGGYRVVTTIVINHAATKGFFRSGASLSIAGRFITDLNATGIKDDGFTFDFSESQFVNDGSFQIIGASFNPNAVNLPNFSNSSTKARFRNNTGIMNTYVGGELVFATTTTTTISAQSVPTLIAGTTALNNAAWLSQIANNQLRNDSTIPIRVGLIGSFAFSGGNNKEFKLHVYVFRNATSTYEQVSSMPKFTTNGGSSGTRSEGVSIISEVLLNNLDILEFRISNETDTSNVTVDLDSRVLISERQS